MEDRKRARVIRNIAFTFAVLTVLLAGAVAYTALSRATVTVTLSSVKRSANFRIALADTTSASAANSTALPATFVEFADSVTNVFTPTATAKTGKAGGTVVLKNDTDHDQPLVATTRLLSPGNVLFRLQTAVRVPAHGTVSAVVAADKPGADSAIGPTTFIIPGLNATLQKSITATSAAAMVQGAGETAAVSADDLAAAKKSSAATLIDNAVKNAMAKDQNADVSAADCVPEQAAETDSAKVGDSVKSFTITIKQTTACSIFSKSDLAKRIQDQIGDVTLASPDTLTYTVTNFDPVGKTASLAGTADVQSTVDQQSSIFQSVNFVGMSPDQVRSFLENYEGVTGVDVSMTPNWLKHLPEVPGRIQVLFRKQ